MNFCWEDLLVNHFPCLYSDEKFQISGYNIAMICQPISEATTCQHDNGISSGMH
jgi:hypothetical protein